MKGHSNLQEELGHRFRDQALLDRALTHRSHSADNNERLEFLGDAILNFVIADILYHRFPAAREGQLSRLRAKLVQRQTLAGIAREKSLGDCLVMGAGEMKSGGFQRDSTLSDVLEAIIGATYLDGDLEAARKMILDWFQGRLDDLSIENSQKDAKTRLQEYLQGKRSPLPDYVVVSMTGKAPDQVFEVECRSPLLDPATRGRGGNRRIAEQEAAARALAYLGVPEEGSGGR